MSSQLLRLNTFQEEPTSSGFKWHFTTNHDSSADFSTSIDSDLHLVSPKLHQQYVHYSRISTLTTTSWCGWRRPQYNQRENVSPTIAQILSLIPYALIFHLLPLVFRINGYNLLSK